MNNNNRESLIALPKHAAYYLAVRTGFNISVRPDPALRRAQHRLIYGQIAFRQHQHAGAARNSPVVSYMHSE